MFSCLGINKKLLKKYSFVFWLSLGKDYKHQYKMNEKTKRSANIIPAQKKELLNFMEAHPQLRPGKFSKDFTFKNSQELWVQITEILNSLPGAKKTWLQWRKTWQDIKVSAKRKAAEVKKHRAGTGGGPSLAPEKILSNEDEQIISMIGPTLTDGLEVAEPSVEFDMEEAGPSCHNVGDEVEIMLDHNYSESIPKNSTSLNTDSINLENNKENMKPEAKKKKTKLVNVRRLNNTIVATEKLADQNERRIKQKENFENKRLELYEKEISVQMRVADALEKISNKL